MSKHTVTLTDDQARGLLFLLGGRHQHAGLEPGLGDALGEVELQLREALYPAPVAAESLGG